MKHLKKSDSHTIAKSVISLMIVMVAFMVLVVFVYNQDSILSSTSFQPFMLLIILGMGLLAGLLYLINPVNNVRIKKRKKR